MDADNTKPVLRRDYSALADTYDEVRFRGRNGRFLYETDASIVRELVELTGASSLLDVPVGTGRVLDYLKDMPIRIVGTDLTPGMLDHARARLTSQQTLLRADASRLPVQSGAMDCITCLRFFHLFAPCDRPPFVREFARVLKPDGYLLCSFTNGWYGGGINWVRRALGRRSVEFVWPGEVNRLFPHWEVCAVRGNFLPLQGFFASTSSWAEKTMRRMTSKFPLNHLCWERFYLLRKPR